MRKIYIHIGCAKTGSSALQLWFAKHREFFKTRGVFYPLQDTITHEYEITSGNGVELYAKIINGTAKDYLIKLIEFYNEGDLFVSSEALSSLTLEQINYFSLVLNDLNLTPVIIAYVRNIYDFSLSVYGQLVKRHGLSLNFYDFATSPEYLSTITSQLDAINIYADFFDNINVINYSKKRDSIDSSILNLLDIPADSLPRLSSETVNRSLSPNEISLLARVNMLFAEKFGNRFVESFSQKLSDAIIYQDPEKKNTFFIDNKVLNYLNNIVSQKISDFNNRFFPDDDGLVLTDRHGPIVDSRAILTDESSLIVIKELFEITNSITIFNNKLNKNKIDGYLDTVQDGVVCGWAHSELSRLPVDVIIYLNDIKITVVKADSERLDLKKLFNKNCGFAFRIPKYMNLKAGDEIRARVVGEEMDLKNSPLVIPPVLFVSNKADSL